MAKWKKIYGLVEKKLWLSGKKLQLSGNKTTVENLFYLGLETLALYEN